MHWVGPRASEHLESLSLTEETTESRHNIRIARKTQTGLCCSRGLAKSCVLNMLHFSFCFGLPWFVDFLSQAVGCELCGCAQHLFSQSSTIYFVLFLNISSANVTAPNPRVFSPEKKKISKGLSISPAQAVLQNVAESCSPSLTTRCQAWTWLSLPGLYLSFSPSQLFLVSIPCFELKGVGESLKQGVS